MHSVIRILIVAAYVLFILYDWYCVKQPKVHSIDRLFWAAGLMVAAATVCFIGKSVKHMYGFPSVLLLILAAVALVGMVIALFFTLPKDTYTKPGRRRKTYKGKLYALCRHPGVLFYCLFYVLLWLAMPSPHGAIELILFCVGNIIYMVIQDLWSFPIIFYDYDEYKKRTPMFFPTIKSIRRCIHSYKKFYGIR